MTTTTTAAAGRTRRCARCAYNLQGLAQARCPECGLAFDPAARPPAEVPWLLRHDIGLVAGYYRTVQLFLIKSRTLAEQALWSGRGDAAGSESFRRTTVLIAAASASLAAALVDLALTPGPLQAAILGAIRTLLITFPPLLAFFWIVTLRVPVDLCRPDTWNVLFGFRHLQKFCCAGLGLAPLVTIPAAAAVVAARLDKVEATRIALALVVFASVVVLIAWGGGAGMYMLFVGRIGLLQAMEVLIGYLGLLAAAVLAAASIAWMMLGLTRPFFR